MKMGAVRSLEDGLEIDAARRIGTGILDGLAAIHAEGLHHLDLHGENILVTDSVVKIIDIHYLTSLSVISSIPRQQRSRRDFTLLFSNLARLLKACGRNPRPVNDLQDGDVFDLGEARAAFKAALEAPVAAVERPSAIVDPAARLKACLLEPSRQIELRDLLTEVVDPACATFSSETFSPHARFEVSDFPKRLAAYEDASREVVRVAALLGHWNQEDRHHKELARILRRLSATAEEQRAGTTILLELRWVPFLHVMYAAGIGAVSAEDYVSLAAVFRARLPRLHEKEWSALDAFGATVSEFGAHEYFKAHPQFKEKRTRLGEYFFTTLRGPLEAVLKLGVDYERLFDRFEILLALVHAEAHASWGPIGRYGWKLYRRSAQNTEWGTLEAEAKAEGDAWAPLRAGLFGGSAKRFQEAQSGLWEKVLSKLNWY